MLLVAVLGAFFYDHSTLVNKLDGQALTINKMQLGNVKQADIIKSILVCTNATENAYKKDKTYVSVNGCIRANANLR